MKYAVMNEYEEQVADRAEDTLALYRAARSDMVMLLKTLSRGDGACDPKPMVVAMLNTIELCILCNLPPNQSGDTEETAGIVLEYIGDGDWKQVEEMIDQHFDGFIADAKDLIG